MEKIVKEYDFYNCIIEIIEDIYRDRLTGEIVGNCYTYRITYPGEIVISSDDTLVWYSINDALDAGIYDVCDGDVSMVREMKLRIVLDEI
jgi:hypothetical protein